MTDQEKKAQLDAAVAFFDNFVNTVLVHNVDGVVPMEVMKNYNVLRNELAKLYVDLD